MRRFPYHFQHTTRGPVWGGIPVYYSPFMSTADGTTMLVLEASEYGVPRTILTNDPDFEWNFYRAECHHQARLMVRDGLRRRLPWLRDEDA